MATLRYVNYTSIKTYFKRSIRTRTNGESDHLWGGSGRWRAGQQRILPPYPQCFNFFYKRLLYLSKTLYGLIFPCSLAVLRLLNITRQIVRTIFSISLKRRKKVWFTFNLSVWVTSHEMTYSNLYWFFDIASFTNFKSLQLIPSLQIQSFLTVA